MRIAYFLTHPTQNQAPFIRDLIQNGLNISTVFAATADPKGYHDDGFHRNVQWDVPLLEDYPHSVLERGAPALPPTQSFEWYYRRATKWLATETPDVVWIHGWSHSYCKAVSKAASDQAIPVILRGETNLECNRSNLILRQLHKIYYTHKFKKIDGFLSVGTLNQKLYEAYGVPTSRICLVPYTVDNGRFEERSTVASHSRCSLKESLGIAPDRPVLMFCGKLIEEKGVETLIRSIGQLTQRTVTSTAKLPVLLIVGDGPLKSRIEHLAEHQAPDAVKFLGFKNQNDLPNYYDVCDILILPSLFEPWGLVVNEAMATGRPVIVSDAVGCRVDLVSQGINGSIFPAGNHIALAEEINHWCNDGEALVLAGQKSKEIIRSWNSRCDADKIRDFLATVVPALSKPQ